MVDENRPTGEAAGEPSDSRYFGPFSEPPRSALSSEASYDPIPTFGSRELAAAKWRAGASCRARLAAHPFRRRRRSCPRGVRVAVARSGSVIAVAALTALVIGAAAGFGGATLARQTDPSAATTANPSAPTLPGVTRGPVPPPPTSANTVEIAKRVLPATVMIQVGRGTGSGFLIDREGRIVTNNHVVAGAADGSRIRVIYSDGRRRQRRAGRSEPFLRHRGDQGEWRRLGAAHRPR